MSAARQLGFWACLAIMIGNLIGSGIFLLPAQMAPLGWNSVFGWAATIGGALCAAMVFSRLARAMPQADGPYFYVQEAFGPLAAFVVVWGYWISVWVGNTAIATAAISYFSLFVPAIAADNLVSALTTIALLWIVTAINCLSTRAASGVQLVTTALKLIPLLVVIAIAALVLGEGREVHETPFRGETIGLAGITAAAALAAWAMLGVECAAVAARRVRDPERNIPRATMIGALAVGIIYLLTSTPVTLLLPPDQVAASNAPFALFVATYWNAGLAQLVALFAAISAAGALNGFVLLQGELPLAMARAGTFPRWFAVTSANGIPVRAQIVSSMLASMLLLANSTRTMASLFAFLALMATCATLVLYIGCSFAALRLQWTGRMAGAPALSAMAVIAILFGAAIVYGAGAEAAASGALLVAMALPVYWLMRRRSIPAAAASPAAIPG